MDRRRDDPDYQMHEMKRPTRDREGPRTDATGQEDRGEQDENSPRQVNQRLNAGRSAPSDVREGQREHGSPDALPAEEEEER
jgi:hypothetical protein